MARSELDRAITMGFIFGRMCASVHATIEYLRTLPLLVQALLLKKNVMDAAAILHELEFYSEEDTDNSGNI